MDNVRFNKIVISVNASLPLGWLFFDASRGALGPNPIEFFLRATGVLTLLFLLITLLVTPIRKWTGRNDLIRYRRMLGIAAFGYAVVHLVTYSIFDKAIDLAAIAADVVQRPFIAVGMLAFLMIAPLAVTSTNGWIKRLGGKRWVRLHMLVYPAAILGVVHFWMIVKSDLFYPALFAAVLAGLLGIRVYYRSGKRSGRAASPAAHLREE